MAGIQGITNVHRQATFETNRLKLQRGSLDLPVIDSGEEDETFKFSPKGVKNNNTKATISDPKPLGNNGPTEAKEKGETIKAQENKRSAVVQNSQSAKADVLNKQENRKGAESKPKPQPAKLQHAPNPVSQVQNPPKGLGNHADKTDQIKKTETKDKSPTKSEQSNKAPASLQNTNKSVGNIADKKEHNQKGESKDKTNSKTGQTIKSSPSEQNTNAIKGENIDKSPTAADSKKGHKKESVLSKLNSKSTKADVPSKQEESTPKKQAHTVKPQTKQSESVASSDTKVKSTSSKTSHLTSDTEKSSPRKGSPNGVGLQKEKGNVEVVNNALTNSPKSKKGDTDKKKLSETKANNVPSVNIKIENKYRHEEKQNKTSDQKSNNSRRDKSPTKPPISHQGGKTTEQKLSPKGEQNLKTSNNVENVSVNITPKDNNKEKSNKANDQVTNKQVRKSDNSEQSSIRNKPALRSNNNVVSKTKQNTDTRTANSDHSNGIYQDRDEQLHSNSIASSPRSVKSNASEDDIVSDETDTEANSLPLNKAPVGTILKTQNQQKADPYQERDKEVAHKLQTENSVRENFEDNALTPNPLVEGIAIESRESKMDGKRRESYEGLQAERNTLLKAEKTYKARIKQLEDEANGFLRVIEDLTSENRSLRKKIEVLENELHADGKTNVVEQLENMEEENRALKTLMKGQKEVIAELRQSTGVDGGGGGNQHTENRELKLEIVKLQTENQTQNEENVKLKADYYETVKKMNSLIAEKSEKSTKDNAVDDRTKRLIKTLQNESAEHKKQIDTLEYENKTLSESLAQKKTELQEILGVMKDENKFDNELKDLKNEVIKLKKERRELELEHVKEKRDLHVELEEKSSMLTEKNTQYDELKIKADELETENGKLKNVNEDLTKDKCSLQNELDRLKEEVERLESELQESKDMYNKLLSQTESASNDLKATKTELEQFNRDLQSIVADKESQISKLISQLDTLRQDKESEKKTFVQERDSLKTETERLKVFETHYLQKEKELQTCQGKLEESDLKRKQLAINLEDKGFEVSNLQQQVFELNMKLDGHTKRMNQLDKDKRELEVDKRDWEIKKDKVNDIESSNKRLLEENKRLRNQLEITTLATEQKPPENTNEPIKSPAEAWVQEKANQPSLYIKRERNKKKVHIMAEHSVSKKRQPFTKSSPVRSTKPQSKREVLKVALNSSRSLEDIRRTPERRGTPDSQPSLPEVNKEPRLTVGGSIYGGYSEIHRNRIRAAHKRVY